MQFGMGHPPPTYQLQSTCVGEGSRVPNLQTEFNYLDSFKSYGIFSDFVVPMVPMSSPSSPHHPCHPHVIPIAPRRSPCSLHGCGLSCLRGLHPMLSPWSPCCPHVVPVSSPSSSHRPHSPRRSPCGLHGCGLHGCGLRSLRCLRRLHPMLSPWSPRRPRCPPPHPRVICIIPTLSRRSPHYP